MDDLTVAQRERVIIQDFRQATRERAQAEAEEEAGFKKNRMTASSDLETARQQAKATFQRERKVAEERLQEERVTAQSKATAQIRRRDAELHSAREALEQGRESLTRLRMQSLLGQSSPTSTAALSRADFGQEFSNAVVSAKEAAAGIATTVEDVLRLRAAAGTRRRVLVAFILIALVSLLVVGHFGSQTQQNEQLYQSAVASLGGGDWRKARTDLQQLVSMNGGYKDAQTLLRESHYRPAVAALEGKQWEQVRIELNQLFTIDGNYKDSQSMLRESHYRPALGALEAGQWEQTRSELRQLMGIDGSYKDGQTLLRESHYRPAAAAIEAKQWEQVRAELNQLITIDSNYKDSQSMLRESYYRPAVLAIERGQWDNARTELEELASMDGNYKDTQALLRDIYYQLAMMAVEAGQWDKGAEAIVHLNRVDPTRTDMPDLIAARQELRQALQMRYHELWSIGDLAATRTLSGHQKYVRSVAFSPDGRTLASAGDDDTVKLWEVTSGQQLRTLGGHQRSVLDRLLLRRWRKFSLGERRVHREAVGGRHRSGTAKLPPPRELALEQRGLLARWPNRSCGERRRSDEAVGRWYRPRTAKLRRLRGSGTESGLFIRWRHPGLDGLQDGEALAGRHWAGVPHPEWPPRLGLGRSLLPDGKTLASASRDRTVKLWEVASGQELRTLTGHENPVLSVAFSPDGGTLASAGADTTVKLWQPR